MSIFRKVQTKQQSIIDQRQIPGVGVSIANDLWNIDIISVANLKGKDAYSLFILPNNFPETPLDRCILYESICAIYFANTPKEIKET